MRTGQKHSRLWLRLVLMGFFVCHAPPLTAPLRAQSTGGSGKIVEIASNGDVVFSDGKVLRLQGIDLPGSSSCYGDERQRYMAENFVGKNATYTIEKADLLGKDLAYVNAGGDMGADLISAGYGFALLSFKYDKQDRYVRAQEFAQSNKRGLWTHCEV